ncbi:MAG: hypothetical protein PHR96_00110 [Clostridia bacterium]|nr:hypothetical protein [Clostridia bacterium]
MADKKPVYIRCPRCELNYCLKKDKYCSVCKAEMNGNKDFLIDDLDLELCPICKTNYIQPDEIMCATCLKERKHSIVDDTDIEQEWDEYINRDETDYVEDEETGEMASVSELDEDILGADLIESDLEFADFEEDAGEDDEDSESDEDDFEEVDADESDDKDDDDDI